MLAGRGENPRAKLPLRHSTSISLSPNLNFRYKVREDQAFRSLIGRNTEKVLPVLGWLFTWILPPR